MGPPTESFITTHSENRHFGSMSNQEKGIDYDSLMTAIDEPPAPKEDHQQLDINQMKELLASKRKKTKERDQKLNQLDQVITALEE